MKVFAVLCLGILAVTAKAGLTKEEGRQAFRALAQGCKEETGATDADIEGTIMHEPSKTMESKCLRACLMKKFDVMSPEGKLNKDIAMKIAEMHTHGDPAKMKIADEVTDVCKELAVSDDHCEAAEQYGACAITEAGKRGVKSLEF